MATIRSFFPLEEVDTMMICFSISDHLRYVLFLTK